MDAGRTLRSRIVTDKPQGNSACSPKRRHRYDGLGWDVLPWEPTIFPRRREAVRNTGKHGLAPVSDAWRREAQRRRSGTGCRVAGDVEAPSRPSLRPPRCRCSGSCAGRSRAASQPSTMRPLTSCAFLHSSPAARARRHAAGAGSPPVVPDGDRPPAAAGTKAKDATAAGPFPVGILTRAAVASLLGLSCSRTGTHGNPRHPAGRGVRPRRIAASPNRPGALPEACERPGSVRIACRD